MKIEPRLVAGTVDLLLVRKTVLERQERPVTGMTEVLVQQILSSLPSSPEPALEQNHREAQLLSPKQPARLGGQEKARKASTALQLRDPHDRSAQVDHQPPSPGSSLKQVQR
ncbi:hypothetical protein OOU_Y34scaffold00736g25 [Pyricularia oryzae Y34]|uniref:Uncharacterized protein n=1 Tax=Pyricularia oryzae (strain Y34) TaxID=1143189 RepID=A0AA97NRI3_PYRO3|nr:hypothetical protein OOU_Y34scaffold00736g25 [Pyricularia oryzae Y34]